MPVQTSNRLLNHGSVTKVCKSSSEQATVRASSSAAGTTTAQYVVDIARNVDISADVQHTQHLNCQCDDARSDSCSWNSGRCICAPYSSQC